MPETVQHLIGQLADGRFPLRKLLGVSQNSAVFHTSAEAARPGDPVPDAAIKLIPEDPDSSNTQLERWAAAAKLSHPGLLRIFHFGRCVIDGSPCLYVVSELADEDLGQLLPQRALTADEARGMLAPVLAALDFLHEQGFVHAGLKPSNIHAIGDNVKLSSDRILPAGESSTAWPLAALFAAPESLLFPAADMWSLGVTVCQTLTQALPERQGSGKLLAPELPAPFAEMVRSALLDDATLRISLDSVRALLDPAFIPKRRPEAAKPVTPTRPVDVAALVPDSPEALIEAVQPASAAVGQASVAAASASGATSRVSARATLPQIDPLSVPLSPVEPPTKAPARTGAAATSRTAIPVTSLPQVKASVGSTRGAVPRKPSVERSNKLALVAGAAAILLAILFVPRLFLRSANSPARPAQTAPVPDTASSSLPPKQNSASSAASAAPAQSTTTAPVDLSSANFGEPSSREPANSEKKNPATPTSVAADESGGEKVTLGKFIPSPTSAKPTSPAANPLAPSVIRKILPEVSEKSRATIHGTVRINVRVQLNPDGTVSSAELANPAPSEFFANLALKAARQWQFGPPPSADGAAEAPASAVIRFDITQTGTAAYLP